MSTFLPYDPGILPTKKSPSPGEVLNIKVDGLPPTKKQGASLRNPKSPRYDAFVSLREAATKAMNGRAWYFGQVALDLTIYDKNEIDHWGLNGYMGGIMDTLDGSCGVHFTYLPIVYEDDCQVSDGRIKFIRAESPRYELKVTFL